MTRDWSEDVCEAWNLPDDQLPQGHDSAACLAWNSASVDHVDLDVVPAGRSHWADTTAHATIQTDSGTGGSLPPGYGDPNYFSFSVPVTIWVSYS